MTMDWNGPYFTVSDIRRLVEGKFTTGISAAERAAIDKRVANFLRTKSAPGISIAIARNDRLVYAKGFGYAKKPIWWALFTRGEPVSVWHRLRIASVTKPITSAAIFTLIEQGRFSLSDKVFGTGGLLGNNYGYDKLPAGQNKTRLGQITVQHLLEHTAGLPPNNGNDPMFIQPSMDHAALITWTLKNYNVASNPGSVYAYSNFGYCLLGRIIEARGFLAYPTYIQSQIMPLCDVQTVALAGDTLAERQRDEVVYYKSSGASSGPYDIPVARMDAHGGLISTAIDVVRFAIHLDGLPAVPDILSSASIASMTTPTSGRYAKGWAVDQRSIVSATGASTLHTYRNHNGSLPGTIAWIVNRDDDLSWAALVNAGNPPSTDDVLDLMWDIVGSDIRVWPDSSFDLFPVYDNPWRAFLHAADPHPPHYDHATIPPLQVPPPPLPSWQQGRRNGSPS
jgi:CubicO group peptidase (beta-lactamase class C family)